MDHRKANNFMDSFMWLIFSTLTSWNIGPCGNNILCKHSLMVSQDRMEKKGLHVQTQSLYCSKMSLTCDEDKAEPKDTQQITLLLYWIHGQEPAPIFPHCFKYLAARIRGEKNIKHNVPNNQHQMQFISQNPNQNKMLSMVDVLRTT